MRLGERMVQLVDGRKVSNYSEEWRLECHARDVAGRSLEDQEEHLAAIEKRHGPETAHTLRCQIAWLDLAPRAGGVLKMPKDERKAYYARLAVQYSDALARAMRDLVTRLYKESTS